MFARQVKYSDRIIGGRALDAIGAIDGALRSRAIIGFGQVGKAAKRFGAPAVVGLEISTIAPPRVVRVHETSRRCPVDHGENWTEQYQRLDAVYVMSGDREPLETVEVAGRTFVLSITPFCR